MLTRTGGKSISARRGVNGMARVLMAVKTRAARINQGETEYEIRVRDETEKHYPIWEVIQRGNGPVSVSTDTNGVIKVLPSKTAEEILAREREKKARITLLIALPEDHLAKFYKMTDANEIWEAIKSRFGGNDKSKKMQKYILKQQFKGFSVSNSEGLHKGYDRVFEPDVKGSTASSSSMQNVAFIYENTSSTNEVSTDYGASSSSGHNPQREGSSSYTNELMYSFFANQSSGPQLDHEDLEQLGRKLQFDANELVGFDKTKFECYNCHKTGHFSREYKSKGNQDSRRRDAGYTGYKAKDSGRRPRKQEEPKALVTLDGEGVDWTSHSEDEQENYALMAYSNSGSDTKEKIRFMKIDLDDKTDVLTYHKKLLAEAEKEKEELKAKVEKWHNSSKNLNILLTSQMSARDKAGIGYGNQMNKGVLSYENELFESVVYSRSSDIEDSPVNDRYAEGMYAVPPLMTGIYIPSGPDVEIDESQITYGPKQSKPCESDARSSNFNPCESNSSEETLKSMPEPVVNEPTVVSQPKVYSDAPIIEEYESDSDDEHVALTNAARKVNTVKPIVNNVRPKTVFHKTQSPFRRPFYRTTTPRTKFSNQKVNTTEVKAVSAVGGKRKTVVKPSADVPHKALENKGIVDSGCSRHMTGNKAYLAEYQDYNGGPVQEKKGNSEIEAESAQDTLYCQYGLLFTSKCEELRSNRMKTGDKVITMFKCRKPADQKSTIPNTIIPPKVYPQIGRPLKKRNKSAAESDEGMVRGNKLSRAGKSISCDKAPLATQASQTGHTTLFHPLQLHASPTKMTKATVARKIRLPKDIYKLINHNIEAKAIWDNVKMLLAGSELTKEDRESQLYDEFKRFKMLPGENINEYYVRFHKLEGQIIVQNVQGQQNQNQRYFARGNDAAGFGGRQNRAGNANAAQENKAVLDEEELLFRVGEQPNTFDADVDNQPVRDLARNEDNIFQADECDAFDSDVDDEPTAQSIFMANLSSAGPTNLQASSSDASILSEVPDLENANVASNNDQVEHEIHSEVQQSTVIDSNNADMGNSNVIPYEQYLTTNDVSVVPSCASSAPNTAYVLIDNNVHTPNELLVTELAIYKEQVAIYEQRAKFELTEREQRMDDQMRILIQDRNRMEEKLKQELHSVKLQLYHSI
ncbi:hypothetical protein Tco_0727392 [Tanacetum coccineum]|uniref:Uncharacterized protein n=1 Tax=Tanacetum coccineum TaxID=301880 RepID=A0ABQ4YJ83_9ASTR